MKKILCAFLLLSLVLIPVAGLVTTALDEDVVLVNLLPDSETDESIISLSGCTLSYGWDDSVTVELTAPTATILFKMVDLENNMILAGGNIDLANPAYCVVDYGTADGVQVTNMLMHYTRKDKQAVGAVADLYLVSMFSPDYATYQKKVSQEADGAYVVWDWGTYVSSSDAKVFDDKIHRFTSTEITLSGKVGSKITFYSVCISSSDDPEGLGAERPEPEESSEVPSEDPSEDVSEAESEDTPSEDVSEDVSEAESEAESVAESTPADESSEAESVAESVAATSSAATSSSAPSTGDSDGLSTGAIVAIIIGIVAVIAVVVVVIVKRKK